MAATITKVKCTHVVAQVSLGYYDTDDNLVGEELYPQNEGNGLVARLFHPQCEQLANLIELCVQQAWEKLTSQGRAGQLLADGEESKPRLEPSAENIGVPPMSSNNHLEAPAPC